MQSVTEKVRRRTLSLQWYCRPADWPGGVVVALTAPRAGVGIAGLAPGVVGGQTGAGRPQFVHQAVHQLAEGVVDRGVGGGVQVPTDDDQVSAEWPRVIVCKFYYLDRLLLSDRTVEGLTKRIVKSLDLFLSFVRSGVIWLPPPRTRWWGGGQHQSLSPPAAPRPPSSQPDTEQS